MSQTKVIGLKELKRKITETALNKKRTIQWKSELEA
jgi:hypothetical protein